MIKKLSISLLIIAGVAIKPSLTCAQENYEEYTVKASFILNFIKLINFKNNCTDVTVCIKDGNTVYPKFKPLQDKIVKDLFVEIVNVDEKFNTKQCDILFLARTQKKQEKKLIKSVDKLEVVTIGETDSFISNGGIINFYREKDRIRFAINKKVLNFSKLSFSSKLLKIAKVI